VKGWVLLVAAGMLLPCMATAQWWNPFTPKDYEECAEQAAKDGRTPDGLRILVQACQRQFQARRDPKGNGYRYYDTRSQ
jgi:hypothetical protein